VDKSPRKYIFRIGGKLKTLILNALTQREYAIAKSAEILLAGGLVAILTETVYGLGANAFDERAVSNIFAAKGRPADNPLIVHVNTVEMAEEVAHVTAEAKILCEKFWPGPLTLVLKSKRILPEIISAGQDTLAVRMPAGDIIREIIDRAGVPLAAPSANVSGRPSPTTAAHVLADLSGKIDAVADGGPCAVGIESTVVDMTGIPTILRPGAVTAGDIGGFFPDVRVADTLPKDDGKILSPGMKYCHYAPKTKLTAVISADEEFYNFINNLGNNTLAVCYDEDVANLRVPYVSLGPGENYAAQANRLFAALREIDEIAPNEAYIRMPDRCGIGAALYNRLTKACSGRIVEL